MAQFPFKMSVRRWIWPLVLVSVFIFVLSLRQLSDPDLGFHLKYGKWIVTNQSIPVTDLSTYTVTEHPYIDLHWLFQVILYAVYRIAGYPGISLFICFLSLLLSLMLLLRQRLAEIPLSISCISLFVAFLIIDPRIAPRPEMFSFLFLTGILFVLDFYIDRRKDMLFLLPVIMLFWCNIHALFILGLVVISVYFISILFRDRKPDKSLLIWMIISFLVCVINPYGIKGFSLPIELLTRFDPDNIYNQQVREFIPFFAQPRFYIRDYLFMIMLASTFIFTILTLNHRKLYEFILLILFGVLAISSIRNMPLFVLIVIPILSTEVLELSLKIRLRRNKITFILYFLMLLLPLACLPRLLTNAYYLRNNSYNKTWMGVDLSQQPVQAANFLMNNHLNGRIINSLGFGGWLSWQLPQPVFIDGRLEVMQESIYKEVTESWNYGLPNLISKYKPQLIIYNYLKYYPWTLQLKRMSGWRLIYIDGITAIFAINDYAKEIPKVDLQKLPSTDVLINQRGFDAWLQGFYRQSDYASINLNHQALFKRLIYSPGAMGNKAEKAVKFFNSANVAYRGGDINKALADYDSAINLQPAYSKAYNNRAILLASSLKNYQGAISDFNKAIDFDPKYADAYLGRGTAYFFLQNIQAACKDWDRARLLGNVQAARLIELHCNR